MRLVVLASGGGSNFQALIDDPVVRPHLQALICNRPDAGCLERAEEARLPHAVIDHTAYESREAFDQALALMLAEFDVDGIILAGFMRILSPGFMSKFDGKIINIHPSLLPKYKGLNTHERALAAGDKEAGVTVHFVTSELDGGPRVGQRTVPVLEHDTPQRLAHRVLQQEHRLYPAVVRAWIDQRLELIDGVPYLDGEALNEPARFDLHE